MARKKEKEKEKEKEKAQGNKYKDKDLITRNQAIDLFLVPLKQLRSFEQEGKLKAYKLHPKKPTRGQKQKAYYFKDLVFLLGDPYSPDFTCKISENPVVGYEERARREDRDEVFARTRTLKKQQQESDTESKEIKEGIGDNGDTIDLSTITDKDINRLYTKDINKALKFEQLDKLRRERLLSQGKFVDYSKLEESFRDVFRIMLDELRTFLDALGVEVALNSQQVHSIQKSFDKAVKRAESKIKSLVKEARK